LQFGDSYAMDEQLPQCTNCIYCVCICCMHF